MNYSIIHQSLRGTFMQSFGKLATNFDHVYLIKHYIYINTKDDERNDIKINKQELQKLLKKKSKNVAGTIFLYNPTVIPKGYNNDLSLEDQGFHFDDTFYELEMNEYTNIFSKTIKEPYRGKLIEIKYLFNFNKHNIEPTSVLEEFDADLDRYNSNQLTRYDKQLNYQDYLNISYNGKFVYFASGHKHDRHHKEIIKYAKNIALQTQKLGKEIVFTHDRNFDQEECIEEAYFLSPLASGKMRDIRFNAFEHAFKTNPPTIQRLQ